MHKMKQNPTPCLYELRSGRAIDDPIRLIGRTAVTEGLNGQPGRQLCAAAKLIPSPSKRNLQEVSSRSKEKAAV